MEKSNFALALAFACAEMEGFFNTHDEAVKRGEKWPTVAQRNNNPGNIMDLKYYKETGKFRVQYYEKLTDGWNAARKWWVRRINEGKTLREAITRYAPPSHGENKTEEYITFVSKRIGIKPNIPLRELLCAKSSE